MDISNLKRKHIVWIHIIFWSVELFIGFSHYIFSPNNIPAKYYLGLSLNHLLWICSFYISYGILVPFALRKGRVLIKLIIIVTIYITVVSAYTYYVRSMNILYYKSDPLAINRYILNAFTYMTSHMILGVIFRLAINGLKAVVLKSQLEKQNLKSELALLRSQINPHFLFNTLNNIHSFAHSDSDKTAFSIIKLSEIMRYMLNESNSERVLLEDEIDYIKSYIALQNIRFSEKEYVFLDIEGDPSGIKIAPMIFVPFIENAFKHGDKRQKTPGVKVVLNISKEEIYFEVCNVKRKIKSSDIEEKSGFGLDNLKRRLELAYPESFNLEIIDGENDYITKLKIILQNEN